MHWCTRSGSVGNVLRTRGPPLYRFSLTWFQIFAWFHNSWLDSSDSCMFTKFENVHYVIDIIYRELATKFYKKSNHRENSDSWFRNLASYRRDSELFQILRQCSKHTNGILTAWTINIGRHSRTAGLKFVVKPYKESDIIYLIPVSNGFQTYWHHGMIRGQVASWNPAADRSLLLLKLISTRKKAIACELIHHVAYVYSKKL